MISLPLVRYVLMAALRDRLILSLLLLMVVCASLSVFLGSAAIVEADEFAIIFVAGSLRLAGCAGIVLFTVFYMRRAFDTRDIDFILSRPVSRSCFIFSHALAFSFLAFITAFVITVGIALMDSSLVGKSYLLWSFSLLAEYVIIANVSLFFAMVIPNAAGGALTVFAFYVLARMIGQLLGIAEAGLSLPAFEFLKAVMYGISFIIPRLDLMAQSSWLVYGAGTVSFGFVFLQMLTFSVLVILAALVDLIRKQF